MPKHNPTQHPSAFPVLLDEFMRLVIGGRLKADRLRTFRAYLRDASRPSQRDDLTQIDQIIQRYKTQGMAELWFHEVRADFLRWRVMQRHAKARNAATKRWNTDRAQSPAAEAASPN